MVNRTGSPFHTAPNLADNHRRGKPPNHPDSQSLRGGVEVDRFGAARRYWVRSTSINGLGLNNGLGDIWTPVDRETSWGRQQFLHVFEPRGDGQTRGANQFLSVMEQLPQLGKLQQTKLQNAIVNAMYAAVIESELGSEAAMEIIGGEMSTDKLTDYMATRSEERREGKSEELGDGRK